MTRTFRLAEPTCGFCTVIFLFSGKADAQQLPLQQPLTNWHKFIGTWRNEEEQRSINIDSYGRVSTFDGGLFGKVVPSSDLGGNFTFANEFIKCSYDIVLYPGGMKSGWRLIKQPSETLNQTAGTMTCPKTGKWDRLSDEVTIDDSIYRAARGDVTKLASYVDKCVFCTFSSEASEEIKRLGGIKPQPEVRPSNPGESHSGPPLTLRAAQPSFDCNKVLNALTHILCSGSEPAQADWDVNSAQWALYFTFNDDTRRDALALEQQTWRQSLDWICALPRQLTQEEQAGQDMGQMVGRMIIGPEFRIPGQQPLNSGTGKLRSQCLPRQSCLVTLEAEGRCSC